MLQTQHCAAPCGPSGWEKAWGRGLGERRRGQGTGAARTRRQGEDCCLYCFGEGQGSGALGGAGPLPLHHHWLLAAQDGAGSADGGHAQIRAVLVLSDHVPDAAESGSGVLVDGGPHVGSGRLSLAGSPLHHHHDPFAVRRRLHAHGLVVNQPVVAEGVAGLQVIGFGAVRLLVPLDEEAGAVPHHHPLQVRGHNGSCGGRGPGNVKGAAGRR
uniref:60S ribosomal protein L28 isoform X2 n=1 Tax=Sus scrofa TaxID=9823 RepID=A0A480FUA3_PIG